MPCMKKQDSYIHINFVFMGACLVPLLWDEWENVVDSNFAG